MTVPPRGANTRHLDGLSSLVERVDLTELVSRYSGPGRASGGTVTFSCPHPGHPDHSPSFTVSLNRRGRQVARCWSLCAFRGDALELVKWLENLSTRDAAEWLRNYLGDPDTLRPRAVPAKPKRRPTAPPKDTASRPTPERASRFLERYLEARGWPSSVVESFGLEVVVDSSGALRVRHPYFTPTRSGEWVSTYWQDRGTSASRAKWLSPKGATPTLYNLRSLERDNLEGVVVCEGPADTVTAALALEGFDTVAVIGCPGVNNWRSEWSPLLEGLRVVVAADNDNAGRLLEEKVNDSLGRRVTYLRPSENDLTDTAKARGLEKVRTLLVAALALEPPAPERSLEETIELLLQVFPGGFVVEGGAA